MSLKVSKKIPEPKYRRLRRKKRISFSVKGTEARPRLSVYRSNKALYAQIIDDVKGVTMLSISSTSPENKGKMKNTIEGAKQLGEQIAKKAIAASVKAVVFDRSGYLYHGKVKAFADGARAGGLAF